MISLLGDPTARAWYRMLAGFLLLATGGWLAFREFSLDHFSERTTGVVTERTQSHGRRTIYRIKYEYRTPGGSVAKGSGEVDLTAWHRLPQGSEVAVEYSRLLPALASRPAGLLTNRLGGLIYLLAAVLAGIGGALFYTGFTRARAALTEW
jgi:hypothetical protein